MICRAGETIAAPSIITLPDPSADAGLGTHANVRGAGYYQH